MIGTVACDVVIEFCPTPGNDRAHRADHGRFRSCRLCRVTAGSRCSSSSRQRLFAFSPEEGVPLAGMQQRGVFQRKASGLVGRFGQTAHKMSQAGLTAAGKKMPQCLLRSSSQHELQKNSVGATAASEQLAVQQALARSRQGFGGSSPSVPRCDAPIATVHFPFSMSSSALLPTQTSPRSDASSMEASGGGGRVSAGVVLLVSLSLPSVQPFFRFLSLRSHSPSTLHHRSIRPSMRSSSSASSVVACCGC